MDLATYVKFAMSLVFVLGLIGLAAAVARRFGPGLGVRGPSAGRRRLAVTEILPLDGKRRLVLVRRDGVEHLLILGPGSETVIERHIQPPVVAPFQAQLADAVSVEARS
jgi:flagellar protein FliO/FliZ